MSALVRSVGKRFLGIASYQGSIALLTGEVFRYLLRGEIRWRLFLQQLVTVGYYSQFVVMLTGAFTGAVFAAQCYLKFSEVGMASATGPVVSIAMCRELGPVLTGFMIAGRVGAAMAAEIGTMRVTEQIDALRSMGVAPASYLVVPRVLATVVAMPVLVAEAILLGILAADLLTVHVFGLPAPWFRSQIEAYSGAPDFVTGLVKAAVFGYIVAMVSCRHGLHADGGASGVGFSTTRAVVDSCIAILVANFFLTLLLNEWLPMVSGAL